MNKPKMAFYYNILIRFKSNSIRRFFFCVSNTQNGSAHSHTTHNSNYINCFKMRTITHTQKNARTPHTYVAPIYLHFSTRMTFSVCSCHATSGFCVSTFCVDFVVMVFHCQEIASSLQSNVNS